MSIVYVISSSTQLYKFYEEVEGWLNLSKLKKNKNVLSLKCNESKNCLQQMGSRLDCEGHSQSNIMYQVYLRRYAK